MAQCQLSAGRFRPAWLEKRCLRLTAGRRLPGGHSDSSSPFRKVVKALGYEWMWR